MDIDELLTFKYTDTDNPTANETKFHAKDAPPGRKAKWERLAKINEGHLRHFRDTEQDRRVDLNMSAGAFTSRLELSPFQKGEVQRRVLDLNIRKMGYSYEVVIMAVCANVMDSDGRQPMEDQLFAELLEEKDIEKKKVKNARRLVKDPSKKLCENGEPADSPDGDENLCDTNPNEETPGHNWDFDVE